ncbi:MAG TPA: UDP-3-O-[3-hydroxymyristoyl] N-acetylglucosamine deacetylase, partial [Ignavibacteria bacterium]|nr:UDP-3-O-[3-hydroxymyristoyl] N-acetylglucosamine deacetylase [Ignavibacteria bacterium]
ESMVQCGSILLLNVLEEPDKKIALFSSIDNVKFRKPVLPGDQLIIEMEMTSYRRNLCKLVGRAYKNQLGGELACTGEFSAFVVDK